MQANLNKHISLTLIIILSTFYTLTAQLTAFDKLLDTKYSKAIELFEKEKYVAALKLFDEILHDETYKNTLEQSNSGYYAMVCAIELYNDDAEVYGIRFISRNRENPLVNKAKFQLANFEYVKKRYKHAIDYFLTVNKEELNDNDKAEYFFKSGYSWFLLDSLDKARKCFYEIKDVDTKYTPSAIYYYSHIAYVQKNYETAISGFNRLKDDETFASLVPYYITQCYYYQEKYDDLLVYAPPLIDSVVDTRVSEMAKMIGDSYYRKKQMKEALPYYEKYFEKGKDFKVEDYYQLGYCYYTLNEYEKASLMFEKSALGNNAVGQSSSYHLGDCYIRLKNKDKALLAFNAASKLEFDLKIKEDAAFNYAVLTFELSNFPFNGAIKALNEYISDYPNSRRSDEAFNYLITAYLNTRNYQEALGYLGKIRVKDKNIKKAYQRAAFFRSLEFFNNLQFEEAQKTLDLALKYADSDPLIAARTYYWMGETAYRLKDIDVALDNYNLFLTTDISKKCAEYKTATYNLAYCYFNKKEYSSAATWFLKYNEANKQKKDKLLADVNNRLGDCKFIESKYDEAIGYYTKAIEIGLANKDYSIFQKAFSLGLLNDHKKKISLLNTLLTSMPESGYTDDALYEIGRSNVMLQKPEEAIKHFNKLISDYPLSSYVKKSLLQLGLIDYNAGRNESAIVNYKKVVSGFAGTPEAKNALTGIKNIYVEMNDVDTYIKYSESLGGYANISVSEQDSLMYYAAENIYTSGDFKKAKAAFIKYLDKFKDGSFALNAHYYKADCNVKAGDTDDALSSFNYVLTQTQNDFTEPALAYVSKSYFDKKEYGKALSYFQHLDSISEIPENTLLARTGQMQSAYMLGDSLLAITFSQKLLSMNGLPQETERKARYILAKSFLITNQKPKALEQFKKLALDVKNVEGAEAKYLVALNYFNSTQYDKAEKEIFNFIDLSSPHQYWMAKAYILLAEIYHVKKDNYQAVNTLNSVIDNYENKDDGIIKEATDKKLLFETSVLPSTSKTVNTEE
jgi:tetratricopeptide (TPR) repeat protein